MKKFWYYVVLVMMMLLSGCGSADGSGANTSIGSSNHSPTNAATLVVMSPTAIPTAPPTPTPTAIPTVLPTPTPTFTPVPTQPQETIVHNFHCLTGVYDAYQVPYDPSVLTIQFIQVTNLGNALSDVLYIKQVSNVMFLWKLRSSGEEVQDGINGYHFGVSVLPFTQTVVNSDGSFGTKQFPAAEVCSSWSTNEQPVISGSY